MSIMYEEKNWAEQDYGQDLVLDFLIPAELKSS